MNECLQEIAAKTAPIHTLTAVAVDTMHLLSQSTQQSCHLVVYSNGRGIIIVQENSPSARGLSVRLGAEAPLLQSCSGHIFLAYAGVAARETMLMGQPPTLKKPQSKGAIQRMVDRVLKQGCEMIESGQVAGVRDIGYPVFDHSGSLRAALVLPFLEHIDGSQAVSLTECRQLLKDAALQISRELGYPATDASPQQGLKQAYS